MNSGEISALLHQRISPDTAFLIGIDGCGGAGKSVLAERISRELTNREHTNALIRMDDFYLPHALRRPWSCAVGAGFDWQRLERQVLRAVRTGQPFRYQRYDWATGGLAEWHHSSAHVVIVEGIYSIRIELKEFYDFTIWVECPEAIRLARGLKRDGTSARDRWLNGWMPEEHRYVSTQKPGESADLIYDGSVPLE